MLRCLPALLLALCMSTVLCADVALESLLPPEGTVGTQLDVRLQGDLGKGKPKLWLTLSKDGSNNPKKTKLKVSTLTDLGGGLASLAASFKKTKTGPGIYDLHVKPKGKGQVEQVFDAVFTLRAPDPMSVTPSSTSAKAQVMITGEFFGGPKKPIVHVIPAGGGKQKKAKVKQVLGPGSLLVKLPKLAVGSYDVRVKNKAGEGVLEGGLLIGAGAGSSLMAACFASVEQPLLVEEFLAQGSNFGILAAEAINASTDSVDLSNITASMLIGADNVVIAISLAFNPGVTATPFTIDMQSVSAFGMSVGQSSPDADWSSNSEIPGTLTVTSASATQMSGTFEFTLVPGGANPAAGDLVITKGIFDLSVKTL